MNNIFFLEEGILDGLWDGIGLFVEGLLRSIFYPICALVYKMIYYFYNIFEVLCSGQLLKRSEVNMLFGRISVLLGIIMLFRVAFSFIQALIDPDTGLGDKDKGVPNVIKKVVIVIIMFGISGFVFDLTAEFQALIIKENVVSKFILPQQINHESFGGALSANLFTAFYNVDPNVDPSAFPSDGTIKYTVPRPGVYEMQPVASQNICAHEEYYINGLRKSIKENNDFNFLKNTCLSARGVYAKEDGKTTEEEFIVEFNFLFSLIVGIAVLWFLINYCLSVGIRVVQLTVLQLISPIAFIGYLEPKSDNMFSKWLKVYISTYLDVFIRMGIINLVCYMCALIMEGWNNGEGPFWESVGHPTGKTALIIGIFMILALFQFAKKAPDLLKSIFPTGSSGLSFGTNKEAFSPATRGIGAVTGAAAYGTMSAISRFRDQRKLNDKSGIKGAAAAAAGGFGSGVLRGMRMGGQKGNLFKNLGAGYSKQVEADDAYRDLVERGGSRFGQFKASVKNTIGTDKGTQDTIIMNRSKRISGTLKEINDLAESSRGYQDFMDRKKAIMLDTSKSEEDRIKLANEIQEKADDFKKEYIKKSLDGSIENMDNIKGVKISSGDKVRSNTMQNKYIDLKAEVDQIKPVIMVDKDGKTVEFTMKKETDVTYLDFDKYLKDAQKSESNVMGQEHYRRDQANKPKSNNNNNS